MQNLEQEYLGQVQLMYIVMFVWGNSQHLSLDGISFLNT